MASAVFFLDLKGKPLLSRNYRGDVNLSAVEKFPLLLLEAEEESSAVPPCFSNDGVNVCLLMFNHLCFSILTDFCYKIVFIYISQ